MPSWLLLIVSILGCTAVPAVMVFAASRGDWRRAFTAWWQFSAVLLALAAPGILVGLGLMIWPPRP